MPGRYKQFSEAEAELIRTEYKMGKVTQYDLASKHNTSQFTINSIIRYLGAYRKGRKRANKAGTYSTGKYS